jgi:hypothetical protein
MISARCKQEWILEILQAAKVELSAEIARRDTPLR